MSLFTLFVLACLLCLCLCVASPAELKKAREDAGRVIIQMRDESNADGFAETPEWSAKWDKVNEDYNAALQAEETAAKVEAGKSLRRDAAERVRADAERLALADRSRMRPDYDPTADRRSRGGDGGFPTAREWGRSLQLWAGVRRAEFNPWNYTDDDKRILARTRVNPLSDEFLLPTGPAIVAMTEEFQEVFAEYHPSARRRAMRQIMAAWNTVTPQDGGYVSEPPQVLRQLEVNRLAWGGLLQVATVRVTTTGEDILLPFTDDTTVSGRRITEDGPLGTEKNPKFGLIRWGAYKYTSDVIAATYEMIRDTFLPLEDHIGSVGGERLGRIENKEATLGNGAAMPRGVVFSAPIGVQTASSTAITYGEVIDLEMSVDDAYQAGDRVGFMMNKNILKYLRKLVGTDNRPLLVLGQETGRRDQLNGKPVYLNYDMDNAVTTGKDVMLYGDFSKVVVRRVGGTRIVRDPYTQLISNDRELFAALEYMDSNTVNAGTAPIKKMRML